MCYFFTAVVYQWKKSEEDMYTGDIDKIRKSDVRPDLNKHIFISGNGKLYFSEVTSADNYYYYCIATLTTLNLNQNFISTSWSPSRTAKPVRLDVRTSGEFKFDIFSYNYTYYILLAHLFLDRLHCRRRAKTFNVTHYSKSIKKFQHQTWKTCSL